MQCLKKESFNKVISGLDGHLQAITTLFQPGNLTAAYQSPVRINQAVSVGNDVQTTKAVSAQNISPASANNPATVVYNRFAQISSYISTSDTSPDDTATTVPQTPEPGAGSTKETIEGTPPANENEQAEQAERGTVTANGNVPIPESRQQGQQQASPSSTAEPFTGGTSQTGQGLTEQQLVEVRKLEGIDREVRSHEQAHVAVGGRYAGAPQFSLKRGPDGVNYAVGGEVPIDVSVVSGDPAATIRKMEQVRRAAQAPADPSPQDRAVSSQATQAILQARAELAQQQAREAEVQREEQQAGNSEDEPTTSRERRREAIQTYLELINLGEQLDNVGQPTFDLSEVV